MAKKVIKISLKLPTGVAASKELIDLATEGAKNAIELAVSELAEAQDMANDLIAKGIDITAEELLARKSAKAKPVKAKKAARKIGRKKAKSTAKKTVGSQKRKRKVLDDAERQALIDEMASSGLKVAEAAEKYGISTATVMNIKTAAGLTKKRGS